MERRGRLRRSVAVGAAMILPVFTGCTGFFPPVNNSGGGGTGATGNQVYVLNQTTQTVSGFAVGTGTLKAVNNSPVKLGSQPFAEVVTPNDAFLYIAAQASINLYLINSDGSLSAPSGGAQQNAVTAASLAVSPDGQWLIALDSLTQQLDIYQINSSTGALTAQAQSPATYALHAGAGTWQPSMVQVSPDATLIFAALGTGGDVVFSFNTTTGLAAQVQSLANANPATGDYALAVDPKTAYLYLARSGTNGGVAVYIIGSGGTLNSVTGSPFAAGSGTQSVVLDSTGTYVYAANRTEGTISGYTIAAGTTQAALTLTPLSGSPYMSGTVVQSLGIDRTGKYLLAAALGGGPDLTMYSFDITTPGKLDPATSINTDTDPAAAVAVALTH
ncbi:lactonase family protein [Tunturiibacter gelidoferens]|jgi:6-phosphogluconolactonase|uniref:6-phosphogluconolactonase (Cycloisomerase 2 family) n=1 Tax=Tunturiibacter gelidiferens TaxID=3069689 RepID=A0A9X0QDW7_9BACT|nr:beta-propeller fold lactonase family protein [Edaphobacter lichenicola]MBB5328592.1 6-phosphogluconolactonase (cycloisomerase 2 family) [Edaphobacter lichenicola]